MRQGFMLKNKLAWGSYWSVDTERNHDVRYSSLAFTFASRIKSSTAVWWRLKLNVRIPWYAFSGGNDAKAQVALEIWNWKRTHCKRGYHAGRSSTHNNSRLCSSLPSFGLLFCITVGEYGIRIFLWLNSVPKCVYKTCVFVKWETQFKTNRTSKRFLTWHSESRLSEIILFLGHVQISPWMTLRNYFLRWLSIYSWLQRSMLFIILVLKQSFSMLSMPSSTEHGCWRDFVTKKKVSSASGYPNIQSSN